MGLRVFFELVALDDAQPARRARSAPPAVARAGAAALPLGDLFEYETKRLEEAKPQPEVLHDLSMQAASIVGIEGDGCGRIVGSPVLAL